MMTLVRVISEHWHAVERDLLSLGYHADDIGTKLSCWEFISIVVAAPPNSAVFHADKRWSQSDELMANLGEQQAGVLDLTGRYTRPGVDPAQQTSSIGLSDYQVGGIPVRLDALPVVDFKAKLAAAQGAARAAVESGYTSAEKQVRDANNAGVTLGGSKEQKTDLMTGQVVQT
jgi:hypothetical protein